MAISITDYNEHDRQIWEEELADFVPARVFDAHVHLLDPALLSAETPAAYRERPAIDLAALQAWCERLYPGRETHFLLPAVPYPGVDIEAHNRMVAREVRKDPKSRASRAVTPHCRLDDIERDVRTSGFVGLKPYMTQAVTGDTMQCRIHEFLPHAQLELANELGCWVTLHLSRHHACADEYNLKDLEEYTTKRYPNVKWILAHCARSFTYWPIRCAIDRLRRLPNIWYDLSAVTDVRPFLTLFEKEDHERLFYGSDGVAASFFHGRYVTFGRAWQNVDTDELDIEFPHCDGRPILSVYEQLLSMKHAAEIAGLSKQDTEDIFWRNAHRALGIESC